jgi:phosphopantothenoylcysteine decarboxylase/phosphopantothenate--cysteine ligase
VTLVAANVELPRPRRSQVVRVGDFAELHDAVLAAVVDADALVMAAAPADFRPANQAVDKIKRAADGSAPSLALVQNPDILATVARERPAPGLVVVGFAAETGDSGGSVLEHGRAKLARKGCDLLVVNDVSGGAIFGEPDTRGGDSGRGRLQYAGASRVESRAGPPAVESRRAAAAQR